MRKMIDVQGDGKNPKGVDSKTGLNHLESRVEELERALATAQRENASITSEHNLILRAFESLSDGVALFNADDRLIFLNKMFRKLNPELSLNIQTGMTFEDMLRDNVKNGRIIHAYDSDEDFFSSRMERHRNPAEPMLSPRKDGRWLLLKEERTPEGFTFLINIDLTMLKQREEALKNSEERFRDFAELGSDWFWETDENDRLIYSSLNIIQLGIDAETLIGKTKAEIGHELYLQGGLDDELEAIRARKAYLIERPSSLKSGKWLSISGTPVYSKAGDFLGYRGVTKDITERKVTEERNKARHLNLLDSTHAVPWTGDVKTLQFTHIGPQIKSLLGYSEDECLEKDFWVNHLHPSDRSWVLEFCLKSAQKMEHYEIEYRMIGSDGVAVWLQDFVTVVRNNDGEPESHQGFFIEITERKKAEENMQKLSARLINSYEEERRKIGRELHDDFGQSLALLTVDQELFKAQIPESAKPLIEFLESQVKRTKDLSSHLQMLSRQLHPSIIEHVGLVSTIRSLCKDISDRHDIDIEFLDDRVSKNLPEDIALCFYRVVQESLRNVIKHSGAQTARVELNQKKEELTLRITDTGSGFDSMDHQAQRGLGLFSMRERLRSVGGEFAIARMEPNGTRVDVRVRVSLNTGV